MRKAAALAVIATLAAAGTAIAAGPSITASVSPNTPNAHAKLTVMAKGPFSAPGLPTSAQIDVQKGFRASVNSVAALCSSKHLPCPAKSKIGSGRVVATVTLLGKQSIPFNMYLGKPRHKGDIASIVLTANAEGQPEHVTGRLFTASGGGLEILFDHLPSSGLPPGSATLNKLTLSAQAVHKMGKKTYSLITNPPKCGSGQWTGSVTISFQSGPVTQPLTITCKK
jgi:hypothetical protein